MRTIMLIRKTELVNAVVIEDDAVEQLDAIAAGYDHAVDVTDLDPQPGLGLGWTYSRGKFVPPPVDDEVTA